jgi:hypothetical protein
MTDRNEVSNIMDMLGSLDEIESGTNKPSASQETFNATRDLLSGLNEIGLAYGNLLTPENAVQDNIKSQPVYENYDDFESQERLNRIYEQNPDGVIDYGHNYSHQPVQSTYSTKPAIQPQSKPKTEWSLSEGVVPGTKSTKMYSVVSNYSGTKLMDGIMMYEAALTLTNLLNEGRTVTDTKILGIISSGLQYTSVVNEGIAAAKERNKVLKESRYDEAKDLDIIIAEKKAEAYKLKERVLNFLQKEGYISK